MLKTVKSMTPIRYIDGNNLYASQMIFDFPTEGYKLEVKCLQQKLRKEIKK